MKSKVVYKLGLVLAWVLSLAQWGSAAQILPFTDGIETYGAAGSGIGSPWTIADTNVVLTVSSVRVAENTGAAISEGMASVAFDAVRNYQRVWCQVYVRPVRFPFDVEPTLSSGVSAAFFVDSAGNLRARSGATWVTVASSIPTNTWLGVAANLDYAAATWDLYLSTSGAHGAPMTRMNSAGPLAMSNTRTNRFVGLSVASDLLGHFDAVRITASAETPGVGAATNVVVATTPAMPVVGGLVFAGTTRPAQGTLDGAAGAFLGTLVDNNDSLFIQDDADGTVSSWRWLSGVWVSQDTPAKDPALTTLTPTRGLILQRATATPKPGFAFDTGRAATLQRPLRTNDWNLLAWPLPASTVNGVAGKLPLGAGSHFLFIPGTGANWDSLIWTGTNWLSARTGVVSNRAVPQAQSFWYFRGTAAAGNYFHGE